MENTYRGEHVTQDVNFVPHDMYMSWGTQFTSWVHIVGNIGFSDVLAIDVEGEIEKPGFFQIIVFVFICE